MLLRERKEYGGEFFRWTFEIIEIDVQMIMPYVFGLLLHVLHYKLKLDLHFERGAFSFVKRFSYDILDSGEN